MANTSPVTDTAEAAERVLDLGRAAGLVDVHPVGAVTRGLEGEELAELGLMHRSRARVRSSPTTAGASPTPRHAPGAGVRQGLRRRRQPARPGPRPGRPTSCCHEGEVSGRLGLPGWPGVAEEVIVARDVMLARHTGSRVHVAHVSTAGTVEVLRWARSRASR